MNTGQGAARRSPAEGLVLWLALFLFVFGWKVTYYVDLIPVVSVVLCVLALALCRPRVPRGAMHIGGWLVGLTAYAALIVVANGAREVGVVERSARALVNFAGGVALVSLYMRTYGERFARALVEHMFLVLVAHGGLMLAMYLHEGLREAIYTATSAHAYVNLTSPFLQGLRIPGLTYGLAQTSVVQMFGLLLVPSVLSAGRWGGQRLLSVGLGVAVLVGSLFLSGRMGMLLGAVLVPPVWWMSRRCLFTRLPRPERRRARRKLHLLTGALALGVLVAVAAWPWIPGGRYLVSQASEIGDFFTSFGRTGTTRALWRMLILPDSLGVFFFGDSGLGRGAMGHIRSDIGFVRVLFGLGVVGSLLMLVPYILGLRAALRTPDRLLGIATAGILAATVLLHWKELALLTRNQWSVQSVLIGACLLLMAQRGGRANPSTSAGQPSSFNG